MVDLQCPREGAGSTSALTITVAVAAAATDQNLLADQSADSPALTGPADTGLGGSDELDQEEMVDVARIDGKVRASALKKIEEIVERHPEETIGILRQWMGEDS